MRVLDLFSGIGGFSLGLERAGMKTVAFCEIDPFCQQVLRKHWPDVPIYNDVRTLNYDESVDVICGGFPCQDLSAAGKKKGIQGERSSLYLEMLKLSRKHKPRWVIFENVTELLRGGGGYWFSRFLNDLAKIGYDAQWHCISASSVGAIHHRDRVWIIAYPSKIVPDDAFKIQSSIANQIAQCWTPRSAMALLAKAKSIQFTPDEPDHRMLDGISIESYAHGSLGNAVVPQIPEIIGKAIMEVENAT